VCLDASAFKTQHTAALHNLAAFALKLWRATRSSSDVMLGLWVSPSQRDGDSCKSHHRGGGSRLVIVSTVSQLVVYATWTVCARRGLLVPSTVLISSLCWPP
jgi:hypothetical protein